MNELLQCLYSANSVHIKLFFITRRRNQTTKEISYDILTTRIQPTVSSDLKTFGVNQIQGILSHDHEIIEYGILSQSDRYIVETIDYQCVPFLSNILAKIARPNENLISEDDYPHIWGYVVRIENADKTVFLFRKYTPKKLLEKDKLSCVIDRTGQFAKLSGQAIALDAHYDAALLIRAHAPGSPEQASNVFILSHGAFESLFSFVDEYRRQVDSNQDYLRGKEILEDVSQIVEICCADTRALKKLARILHDRPFDLLNPAKIRETIQDYNLPVTVNEAGKIQINQEYIWDILRILDDDYGESKATGNKYEMRSKVRK